MKALVPRKVPATAIHLETVQDTRTKAGYKIAQEHLGRFRSWLQSPAGLANHEIVRHTVGEAEDRAVSHLSFAAVGWQALTQIQHMQLPQQAQCTEDRRCERRRATQRELAQACGAPQDGLEVGGVEVGTVHKPERD